MSAFAERRQRVLEAIDGVAILASAPVTIRNNDVEHEYRQDSDLFYLTGFTEPDAVLLLSSVHPEHRAVMFVRPRDKEREIWDGERAGVEGVKEQCGVDAAFPIAELGKKLSEYLAGANNLYYELGKRPRMDERILLAITRARGRGRNPKPWPKTIHHPEAVWHEMRLFKDESELLAMRRAAAITAEAHRRAMAETRAGVHEYDIEATLKDVFRRRGAERAAYPPIVGSGPNATVLHYRANKRQLEGGELLLIDAGCEFAYYAADVTRTFPVDGTFTAPQRAIYEAVLDAQEAAIAVARPGATIERIHEVTLRRLVDNMIEIGLLSGERQKIIQEEKYKRFFMHRTSHWLGMDVHDVGAYFLAGKPRELAPGMVLTIEPGIYVARDDDEAPEPFRGIGVRIEDDILITGDGHENLSAAIPKTVAEIEHACRG
jgi:Xaa-Pro aminopeptidase